jgi:hypothetical protein
MSRVVTSGIRDQGQCLIPNPLYLNHFIAFVTHSVVTDFA